MTEFTPIESLVGGTLIGLSAVMLMLFHGRIAGVSGILGRLLPPYSGGKGGNIWRLAFVLGMIVAPSLVMMITGNPIDHVVSNDMMTMIAAGLIVGIGTGIGSGCTSGHGVCGIPRLSKRSIIATVTFMAFGIITVFIIRHVVGV
ncbi:YeeE/YedE family protein [Pseudemcibacter aquimaris]|uniref:YeeE/YedE family protein n=1 Tax=Pseudemcibacter aquimaris TaxID=2857064 RepID=UPI002010D7FE|nr:YeeE/YedE family protein [Pseudemcibacter aquimaris]MCC3861509.1 YeeE/YedE family protein [Pseudemcibacter aquimaris]WDU58278.1 YeeE/YedE family protein [Pseudemcibacter aquimaris]